MNRLYVGLVAITTSLITSMYLLSFIAPDGSHSCREINLIAEHDYNRTRIAKNRTTTDNQKALALFQENERFTAAMIKI